MATYTVNTLFDENDGISSGGISLRDAVSAANSNPGPDTIVFSSSLDNATIGLTNGQIQIDGDVTITGSNNLTRISGRNASRVFYTRSGNITLDRLAIVEGNERYGGGIYNDTNLVIINTTLSNNNGTYGGALYNNNTVSIVNR